MGELQQVTNLFDMTTGCKVTELFCIIDEFCKHFDAENAGNLLPQFGITECLIQYKCSVHTPPSHAIRSG